MEHISGNSGNDTNKALSEAGTESKMIKAFVEKHLNGIRNGEYPEGLKSNERAYSHRGGDALKGLISRLNSWGDLLVDAMDLMWSEGTASNENTESESKDESQLQVGLVAHFENSKLRYQRALAEALDEAIADFILTNLQPLSKDLSCITTTEKAEDLPGACQDPWPIFLKPLAFSGEKHHLIKSMEAFVCCFRVSKNLIKFSFDSWFCSQYPDRMMPLNAVLSSMIASIDEEPGFYDVLRFVLATINDDCLALSLPAIEVNASSETDQKPLLLQLVDFLKSRWQTVNWGQQELDATSCIKHRLVEIGIQLCILAARQTRRSSRRFDPSVSKRLNEWQCSEVVGDLIKLVLVAYADDANKNDLLFCLLKIREISYDSDVSTLMLQPHVFKWLLEAEPHLILNGYDATVDGNCEQSVRHTYLCELITDCFKQMLPLPPQKDRQPWTKAKENSLFLRESPLKPASHPEVIAQLQRCFQDLLPANKKVLTAVILKKINPADYTCVIAPRLSSLVNQMIMHGYPCVDEPNDTPSDDVHTYETRAAAMLRWLNERRISKDGAFCDMIENFLDGKLATSVGEWTRLVCRDYAHKMEPNTWQIKYPSIAFDAKSELDIMMKEDDTRSNASPVPHWATKALCCIDASVNEQLVLILTVLKSPNANSIFQLDSVQDHALEFCFSSEILDYRRYAIATPLAHALFKSAFKSVTVSLDSGDAKYQQAFKAICDALSKLFSRIDKSKVLAYMTKHVLPGLEEGSLKFFQIDHVGWDKLCLSFCALGRWVALLRNESINQQCFAIAYVMFFGGPRFFYVNGEGKGGAEARDACRLAFFTGFFSDFDFQEKFDMTLDYHLKLRGTSVPSYSDAMLASQVLDRIHQPGLLPSWQWLSKLDVDENTQTKLKTDEALKVLCKQRIQSCLDDCVKAAIDNDLCKASNTEMVELIKTTLDENAACFKLEFVVSALHHLIRGLKSFEEMRAFCGWLKAIDMPLCQSLVEMFLLKLAYTQSVDLLCGFLDKNTLIRELVEHNQLCLDTLKDRNGLPLLQICCNWVAAPPDKQCTVVQHLLKLGAHPHVAVKGYYGQKESPLMTAVEQSNLLLFNALTDSQSGVLCDSDLFRFAFQKTWETFSSRHRIVHAKFGNSQAICERIFFRYAACKRSVFGYVACRDDVVRDDVVREMLSLEKRWQLGFYHFVDTLLFGKSHADLSYLKQLNSNSPRAFQFNQVLVVYDCSTLLQQGASTPCEMKPIETLATCFAWLFPERQTKGVRLAKLSQNCWAMLQMVCDFTYADSHISISKDAMTFIACYRYQLALTRKDVVIDVIAQRHLKGLVDAKPESHRLSKSEMIELLSRCIGVWPYLVEDLTIWCANLAPFSLNSTFTADLQVNLFSAWQSEMNRLKDAYETTWAEQDIRVTIPERIADFDRDKILVSEAHNSEAIVAKLGYESEPQSKQASEDMPPADVVTKKTLHQSWPSSLWPWPFASWVTAVLAAILVLVTLLATPGSAALALPVLLPAGGYLFGLSAAAWHVTLLASAFVGGGLLPTLLHTLYNSRAVRAGDGKLWYLGKLFLASWAVGALALSVIAFALIPGTQFAAPLLAGVLKTLPALPALKVAVASALAATPPFLLGMVFWLGGAVGRCLYGDSAAAEPTNDSKVNQLQEEDAGPEPSIGRQPLPVCSKYQSSPKDGLGENEQEIVTEDPHDTTLFPPF